MVRYWTAFQERKAAFTQSFTLLTKRVCTWRVGGWMWVWVEVGGWVGGSL